VTQRSGSRSVADLQRFRRGTNSFVASSVKIVLVGRSGKELLLGNVWHGAGGSTGSDLYRVIAAAPERP